MITALDQEKYIQSYNIPTDTVSEGYGMINTCGKFDYYIQDLESSTPPSIVSLSYIDGATTFDIIVDVKNYSIARKFKLLLVT